MGDRFAVPLLRRLNVPNFTGTCGNDIWTGGSADDTATGGGGNDTLSGGGGNDQLAGNSGADTLSGGDGDDHLASHDPSPGFGQWGAQNTSLDIYTEVDNLVGGAGSDWLYAGYGDNVDGGDGGSYGDYLHISFLGASSGVTVDFSLLSQTIGGGTIQNVENFSWVQGSNFDDYIIAEDRSGGYSDFNEVYGMGGNDHLVAGYYSWILDGGEGNDIVDGRGSQYLHGVYGGDGDDTLYTHTNGFGAAYGGNGNDLIYPHAKLGGAGNDTIILQWSYYPGLVFGNEGDDVITASDSDM